MNVIVLTTGISGSSLITGLLNRSGLWAGDETIVKDNITGGYDTYENKSLVSLNEKLIAEVGLEFDDGARYDLDSRAKISCLINKIDLSEYEEFVRKCDSVSPWIWKDPRLLLTIGFWSNFLDMSDIKVIFIYRNIYDLWVSQNVKRIVYDYQYLKSSETQVRKGLEKYLEESGFSFIKIEYERFIKSPLTYMGQLNDFIGLKLTKDHWNDVYKPSSRLLKYQRAVLSYLIYIKNYRDRFKG